MKLRAALTTLLLLAPSVLAQDPLADLPGLDDLIGGDGGENGLRVTGLKGFLETRARYFLRDHRSGDNRKDGQWLQELQLEIDFALSDHVTGFFRPRFLIDAIDDDLAHP